MAFHQTGPNANANVHTMNDVQGIQNNYYNHARDPPTLAEGLDPVHEAAFDRAKALNMAMTTTNVHMDGRHGTIQYAPSGTFNIVNNHSLPPKLESASAPEKSAPLPRLFKQKFVLKCQDDNYRPFAVTFSSDGQHVISCSHIPCIAAWETTTGFLVSGPGSRLLTAGINNGSHNVNTVPSECGTIPWYQAEIAKLSADGTRMCTGAHLKAVQRPGNLGDRDGVVKVWDVRKGELVTSIEHKNDTQPVTGAELSPNGTQLLTASFHNLRLWDVSTGRLTHELQAHMGSISPVAFSPNGAHVVSVGQADKRVTIWHADTLELAYGPHDLEDIYSKKVDLKAVAMSPSGDKLAMGFEDGKIVVMDVENQQFSDPETQFKGHKSWVTSIAFSPDGQWMISGSWDGTIHIWIVASGKPMAVPLKVPTSRVNSVAISPDGETVASSSWDRVVRTWAK